MTEHVIQGLNSDPYNVHTYVIYDKSGEVNIIAKSPVGVKGIVDIHIYTSVEPVEIKPSIAVRIFGGYAIEDAIRKFNAIAIGNHAEVIELDNNQRIELRSNSWDVMTMTVYSSVFMYKKFRRVACSVILAKDQMDQIRHTLKLATIL